MRTQELFSSRWGLLVAALGMAIGTGNIWRFPRIIAQNGGGAFLVPWLLFLLLWSIPLLMVETAMGRRARKGVVGAFGHLVGADYTWLGCFVGFCSMAIMFYYSVVAGWCIKYLSGAIIGDLVQISGDRYWDSFQASGWQPIFFHLVAMSTGAMIVYRGISAGIERANKVLIPTLFVLLALGALRAVTLPGASAGLNFLFNPQWSSLLDYRIWLEALTQSAWSTGAGMGLLLTYSIYARPHEDIVMNSMTIGFGNNSASLLAGLLVIPTVFALLPEKEALAVATTGGPGGTGLSFVWVPQLFVQVPGGRYFLLFFFLALVAAALSSLIAMIELSTRLFIDAGMSRLRALLLVASGGFLLGLPSALSLDVLSNQDSVWGVGLMVSGFFLALAVRRFGVANFRLDIIAAADNDLPIGRWFDVLIRYVIPLEFVVMVGWWLFQAASGSEQWWNPFGVFTLGTCLLQWGLVLLVSYWVNGAVAARTLREEG